MSEYNRLFGELRYEVWKVSFLNAFLNAALAFFISNVIVTYFRTHISLSVYYSFIPAGIVFIWSLVRRLRAYTLKRIEEGNPEVAEILRTAKDNTNNDELMVHALFLDLMQKMETVTAGIFIAPRTILVQLALIIPLVLAPIAMVSIDCSYICKAPDSIAGLSIQNLLPQKAQALAPTTPIQDAGNRDIYGSKDVVQLGNEKLDITASTGQSGVDFTTTSDATGNQFKYNDYPIQPVGEQTTAGTGGAAGDSALINDYSCKTKKTC